MKRRNILKLALVCTLALTSAELYAINIQVETPSVKHNDKVTETFKVYGNCGMCERTIEGALTNVKGIDKADWNRETKMMEVTFHEHEITLDEIKKKIAAVGYDTKEYKSTDKVYNALPGCCQYERPTTDNH